MPSPLRNVDHAPRDDFTFTLANDTDRSTGHDVQQLVLAVVDVKRNAARCGYMLPSHPEPLRPPCRVYFDDVTEDLVTFLRSEYETLAHLRRRRWCLCPGAGTAGDQQCADRGML